MNASTEAILKSLAQSPRRPGHFTHATHFLGRNEDTMRMLLAGLVEKGLAAEYKDLFSITDEGTAELAAAAKRMPKPRTYGAYATVGSYEPKPWSVRDGGAAALALPSRGLAC